MSITDDRYNTAEAAEIRLVIEKFCGVFKFSSNVKLFCNFCQNELNDHRAEYVEKHLNSVEHLDKCLVYKPTDLNQNPNRRIKRKSSKNKDNRCFSLFTNELIFVSDDENGDDSELNKVNVVIKAFSEGIYINQKFDKIHCTYCQMDICDSFLLLKKHLKNTDHIKKQKRKNCSDRTQKFVEKNPCLEFDGDLVHCKLCKKVIQAKIFNLQRHCARSFHQKALEGVINNDNDNRFARQIQINKNKLKKLIQENGNHLIMKDDENVLCRPCKKIITAKYYNVFKHIARAVHKEKSKKFDSSASLSVNKETLPLEETNDESTTDNSSGDDQNLKTAAKQLMILDNTRLDRLMSENNCLVFYNQHDNVLCKPCKKFMLSNYMNVKNHLRRQSHKDKFEQYQKTQNELTTAIEMIPETDEEQSQIIIVEEVYPADVIISQPIDHSNVANNAKNIEQQQVDKPITALDHFYQMNVEI